jgi:thiamine-monophosphate kinase
MAARPIRGEFGIIADFFAPLAKDAPGAFGLTDDAAQLAVEPGQDLIVTTDALVAGVHFLADSDSASLARKALRVNLSDLAAMGALPRGYLLALALPEEADDTWLAGFAEGLATDQAEFDIALLGGDLVATPGPLTICLTALGEVSAGSALRRAGAIPGDAIYVSGTIGDGALGLKATRGGLGALSDAERAHLTDRYQLPRPRLALGRRLVGLARAALDVSDGLVADLGHVCEASACGADLEAERVPLSPAARTAVSDDPELLEDVLTGGDDYELLFTVAPEDEAGVTALARELALPLTRVGRITAAAGVRVIDADGELLDLGTGGYQHF